MSISETRNFDGIDAEAAYVVLRDRIISGDLQPNEHLVEATLVESLGAGRSTIRLALMRLEHDRLVERERNRGARVRRVSVEEAIEILETRAVLEGLVARCAAERIDARQRKLLLADLATLQQRLESGDLMAASDANAAFHKRIIAIGRHQTAEREISALHSQMVRFQYRTILIPGRSASSFAEHSAVAEAIVEHKPQEAESAMRAHLSAVAEALRTSAARTLLTS